MGLQDVLLNCQFLFDRLFNILHLYVELSLCRKRGDTFVKSFLKNYNPWKKVFPLARFLRRERLAAQNYRTGVETKDDTFVKSFLKNCNPCKKGVTSSVAPCEAKDCLRKIMEQALLFRLCDNFPSTSLYTIIH